MGSVSDLDPGLPGPPALSPSDQALIAAAQRREPRALGRLITTVENAALEADGATQNRVDGLRAAIASGTGIAHVIGVTGPPGVGKSSLTAALVAEWRARGAVVAVVAVDPSSPVSGGALLGDRVRMQRHATDSGVYIRSMSSRGHLGGLAVATYDVLRVLDWAGFDVVLLETVGVGQSEVEVANLADTTMVILAPGLGDGVQAAKAGLLEIADLYVVNKADLPGAQAVVRDLRTTVSLGHRGTWKPPILTAASTPDQGVGNQGVGNQGVAEVVAQVDAHRGHAVASGEWDDRRARTIRHQITSVALARLRRGADGNNDQGLDKLVASVSSGELDTHRAARALLAGWQS